MFKVSSLNLVKHARNFLSQSQHKAKHVQPDSEQALLLCSKLFQIVQLCWQRSWLSSSNKNKLAHIPKFQNRKQLRLHHC